MLATAAGRFLTLDVEGVVRLPRMVPRKSNTLVAVVGGGNTMPSFEHADGVPARARRGARGWDVHAAAIRCRCGSAGAGPFPGDHTTRQALARQQRGGGAAGGRRRSPARPGFPGACGGPCCVRRAVGGGTMRCGCSLGRSSCVHDSRGPARREARPLARRAMPIVAPLHRGAQGMSPQTDAGTRSPVRWPSGPEGVASGWHRSGGAVQRRLGLTDRTRWSLALAISAALRASSQRPGRTRINRPQPRLCLLRALGRPWPSNSIRPDRRWNRRRRAQARWPDRLWWARYHAHHSRMRLNEGKCRRYRTLSAALGGLPHHDDPRSGACARGRPWRIDRQACRAKAAGAVCVLARTPYAVAAAKRWCWCCLWRWRRGLRGASAGWRVPLITKIVVRVAWKARDPACCLRT